MTNQEYLDELEKNRVEMVPKGKIEDSIIIPEQRNVLDFCLKDKEFKEAYVKSGKKDSFEDTLKNFIEYLFENKNNPRIKIYYMKDGEKSIQMMDMEDVFNIYVKYVSNDVEALKKLDEANEKGKEVADMVKAYEEQKKIHELNKQKLVENAVDVNRADLIKYCKVYLSNDFAEKAQIRKGSIFSVNEGAVYDENNQAIYVKGEFQLVYVDEEKNIAITKVLFDELMSQYGNKRKNNNIE